MPKGIYIRKPLTKEEWEKLSAAHRGKTPWNKGLKGVQKNINTEGLKKGRGWNKGLHTQSGFTKGHSTSEEIRRKISNTLKKKYKNGDIHVWCEGKNNPGTIGEKNPNWKGGITPINEKIRKSLKYKAWRMAVFQRDNFTCVFCGASPSGNLNADHIKPFAYYPELRFELLNGRTLCIDCHKTTDTYFNKGKRYQYVA